MPPQLIIWSTAIILYVIFWLWYVGIRKPLSDSEVDGYIDRLRGYENYTSEEIINMKEFLKNDTGKSFVMVNSILLKEKPDQVVGVKPEDTSLKTLIAYHKPFMKMMFKRGGIGIFHGRVAGKSVDVIGIENAEEWRISAINRFRSRRDFMEIITHPTFHEKHELKFAALSKSIAYPVDPWFQLGGLTTTVALVLALVAALIQIFITT